MGSIDYRGGYRIISSKMKDIAIKPVQAVDKSKKLDNEKSRDDIRHYYERVESARTPGYSRVSTNAHGDTFDISDEAKEMMRKGR